MQFLNLCGASVLSSLFCPNRALLQKPNILHDKIKTHFSVTYRWSLALDLHRCTGSAYGFAQHLWSFGLGIGA